MKGIGGHHRGHRGRTDDWLTPPGLLELLGPFDLDPCASVDQPWPTATTMLTEGGLEADWSGRVWCNPPYGPATWEWLNKLAAHDGGGIALVFARTETRGFFEQVWGKADAVLFLKGRLHFHYPVTGERAKANAGGPSCLVAYSKRDKYRLEKLLRNDFIEGALADMRYAVASWRT